MAQRARALTAATTATVLFGGLVPVTPAAARAADDQPPVGSFVLLSATGSDDPGPMVVEVVQNSLRDNTSATGDILREVSWGTGVGFEPWRRGSSIEFSYTAVGRYDLRVRITDEAGNSAVEDLGAIVVSDSFAPRLTVNRPASDQWRTWRSVRGYARDVGLAGMDVVRVKAVQQRARGWYAYQGPGSGWQLAGSQSSAREAARPVRVPTSANGAWSAALDGVRSGTLVVRSVARDREGNRSKPVVVTRDLVG
jgi:hypothetical protein